MIALLTTVDAVKMTAAEAALSGSGVAATVFDRAAGALWTSIIPMRLMVEEDDVARARMAMREAGFVPASDGDWDLAASG